MRRVIEVSNSKIKMLVNLILNNQEHRILGKYVISKQVDLKLI